MEEQEAPSAEEAAEGGGGGPCPQGEEDRRGCRSGKKESNEKDSGEARRQIGQEENFREEAGPEDHEKGEASSALISTRRLTAVSEY